MISFAVGWPEGMSPPSSRLLEGPSVAHRTADGRFPRMESDRRPAPPVSIRASVLHDILGGNRGRTWRGEEGRGGVNGRGEEGRV